jgi:hypothetical protein
MVRDIDLYVHVSHGRQYKHIIECNLCFEVFKWQGCMDADTYTHSLFKSFKVDKSWRWKVAWMVQGWPKTSIHMLMYNKLGQHMSKQWILTNIRYKAKLWPQRGPRDNYITTPMTWPLGLQVIIKLSLEQSSLLIHKMKPKASRFLGRSIEGPFWCWSGLVQG